MMRHPRTNSKPADDLVSEIAEYLRREVRAGLPECYYTDFPEQEPIDLGEMTPDGLWMLMKASYGVLGWPTHYGEGMRRVAREAANQCQQELRRITLGY